MLTLSGSSEGHLADPTKPLVAGAANIPCAHTIPAHQHTRAQLLYSTAGELNVQVGERQWVISPRHAVWIPSHQSHAVKSDRPVKYCSLYCDSRSAASLPLTLGVLQVSPLLRELMRSSAEFGSDYQTDTPESRLLQVFFDQLGTLSPETMPIEFPRDPRLQTICSRLLSQPADDTSLATWSRHCGASERTLARLFKQQLGCSFQEWRQRVRVSHAIERLRQGDSVTAIALDLGYKGVSAFSTMFKRITGLSPQRYFKTY
jgi:AraC-like DNA-binding protein